MLKKFTLTTIWVIISFIANAQTPHDINYTGSSLSTALCNIFNVTASPTVGSYEHWPVSGGVTFDGTYIKLKTQSNMSASSNLGTAYGIKFSFNPGYKYKIAVTAKGVDGSGSNVNYPHLLLSIFSALPNPNTTNPTVCGPVPETNWGVLEPNIVGSFATSSLIQTYTLQEFTIPVSYSYLTVLAYDGSPSPNTLYISKNNNH